MINFLPKGSNKWPLMERGRFWDCWPRGWSRLNRTESSASPTEACLPQFKTELSLESWISLQRREAELDEKTVAARSAEDERDKVYHRVAPNGTISIWLLKGAEKSKAEHLQEDYKSAKAFRESIEHEMVVVRADIQKAIGRFLRDAVSPESLVLLAKESGIKRELSSLL